MGMCDDFSNEEKNKNLIGKKIKERVERTDFFHWLDQNNREVEFLFHIGARTDTTEFNKEIFENVTLNTKLDFIIDSNSNLTSKIIFNLG